MIELPGLLLFAAAVIGGYLLGSVPFGVIATRLAGAGDLRTIGSGNIGATNVLRTGRKGLALITLLGDGGKGALAVLLAALVAPADGMLRAEVTAVAAGAAFLGHLFPVWLGFRGGKGVATALGIFVVLAPWAAVVGVVVYLLAYLATRISSVGSLAGTAACAATAFVLNGPARPVSWAGVVLAALILLRHRENIRRIVSGEEKRKM